MTVICSTSPTRIETAKGTFEGTLSEVVRWQATNQGAFATMIVAGVEVDVGFIDFDAEDIGATTVAVLDAFAAEINPAQFPY